MVSEGVPLLVEQRLFFDDIYPTLLNPDSYGQSHTVRMPRGLRADQVLARIHGIVGRHPALSTTFSLSSDGVWTQKIGFATPPVSIIDICDYAPSEQAVIVGRVCAEMIGIIRIAGPACAYAVIQLAEDLVEVAFVFHHLVCDYFSIQVLARELQRGVHLSIGSDDGYLTNVDNIQRLSYGPRTDAFLQAWSDLPWRSFAKVPSRLSLDSSGVSRTGPSMVVPDIRACELAVPLRVSREIIASDDKRAAVVELLSPAVEEAFGGVVPAAYVEGGRSFGSAADRAGECMDKLTILSVGWFAFSGLVLLTRNDVAAPASYSFGLLQRISARKRIAELLISAGGPPAVWINVLKRPGPAPGFVPGDRRRVDSAAVPMGAAQSPTFVGLPLAFHIAIYRDRVTVNITWDSVVFGSGEIDTLKEYWVSSQKP